MNIFVGNKKGGLKKVTLFFYTSESKAGTKMSPNVPIAHQSGTYSIVFVPDRSKNPLSGTFRIPSVPTIAHLGTKRVSFVPKPQIPAIPGPLGTLGAPGTPSSKSVSPIPPATYP